MKFERLSNNVILVDGEGDFITTENDFLIEIANDLRCEIRFINIKGKVQETNVHINNGETREDVINSFGIKEEI